MGLLNKLTEKREAKRAALREELVVLEERIRMKIRKLCVENKQLPYERLRDGRILKENVLMAIDYLDKKDDYNFDILMDRLKEQGLEFKNY